MKVLMLCDVQGNLGDAIRINKIAERIRRTHELKVVNASDYRKPRRKLLLRPKVLGSFAAHLVKDPSNASYGAYGQLLMEVVREQLKSFDANVVLVEGVLQGGLLANEIGVPLITDVHGLASAEYEENAFQKVNPRKAAFFKDLEDAAFRHSAQVWTVSKPMQEYVAAHGGRRRSSPIVRNGADAQKRHATFSNEPLRAVYGGIFAFWEDVDAFLDLGKADNTPLQTELHLAGTGPLESHARQRLENEKLSITYHGKLKRPESLELFAKMQVGIAPSVDTLTRRVACPIKVFDYMAAGLPVVTPDVGEWAQIVKDEDAGIVTKHSKAEEFASALESLHTQKTWKEKAANARTAIVKRYNWDAVLEPIEDSLAQAARK